MSAAVLSAFSPFPQLPKSRSNPQALRTLLILPRKFQLTLSSSPHSGCFGKRPFSLLTPKASVSSEEHTVEPTTNVKFANELKVPGCLDSLVLLGAGYREMIFAIIGVKVYAAGFYAKNSLREFLGPWKGKSAAQILENYSLFSSILHAPTTKSLKIMLVRDVDGKTFWNALNDVISPRIKEPTAADESALSSFRNTFQGRDLKQGTIILLTWIKPSKMLVSISSDRFPATVDAEIESLNVTWALFDGFFGESPVSPTLKASVANGLQLALNES